MAARGGRDAIKVRAIQELVAQLVEPALRERSLDPIGQATLAVPPEELALHFVPGQDLTLPVRCDVWPDIAWKGADGKDKPYLGLEGSYRRRPPDQSKLDKALADLRERYASNEPIDDPRHALEMGDACTVNMVGYMAKDPSPGGGLAKGEPLPDAASGDRVEVVLGPGRYMEGLVEGLVGAKVGETRTVAVSFPEVSEMC
jgi:trigger factor